MKTLIAYATKGGVTEESAHAIADVLRQKHGFEVDIVNLKEIPSPDIVQYRNIIIGSGIRMGRWYKRALKMLDSDFTGKYVALFLSACSAGDPDKHGEAVKNYLDAVLAKHPHVKPVAAQAFGGRMKMLGRVVDNCDPEQVRVWADEVGRKLKEES
jgi:menaquinone-dependent protoporphyrinogen oxidase